MLPERLRIATWEYPKSDELGTPRQRDLEIAMISSFLPKNTKLKSSAYPNHIVSPDIRRECAHRWRSNVVQPQRQASNAIQTHTSQRLPQRLLPRTQPSRKLRIEKDLHPLPTYCN